MPAPGLIGPLHCRSVAPNRAADAPQSVRLYDASAPGGTLRGSHNHVAPVLDCVFADDSVAYAGCLDGVCTK